MYQHRTTAGIIALLIASIALASVAEAKSPGCKQRQTGKSCWPVSDPPPTSNTAPTISGTPPTAVTTDQTYSFAPTVSDPDGDTLTLSIVNRPPWASFSSSTGRLSGTPDSSDVGEYVDILISVNDGSTTVSLPAFAIDVQQPTQYQVSLTVDGPGWVEDSGNGISCTASCTYTFDEGRTLNLTEQPDAGAHFTSWTGACSTEQQCSVVVSGPLNITATFATDSTSPTPSPAPSSETLANVLNFAETWNRNWNYGGHTVTSAFTADYGYWDYTNTTYEPWLFDRATVGHRLYELTGDTRWRNQFLSDFAWYRARIDANGIFTPKGGDDTKYGYVTPFALYERLTADQQYRPIAKRIYDSWVREWSPSFQPDGSAQLWTEREVAFALEAAVSWYEITGEAAALTRAAAIVQQWTTASGSAGAPLVTYTQHEGGGPGGTTPTNLTNSPWMSALYFQAARRYFEISNDTEVLRQVSRYADWCDSNCFYDAALVHPEYAGLVFPRYLTGELIGDAGYDYGNMGHCLDVGGLLKFALYAKGQRGESLSAIQTRYSQMQTCASADFVEWTRTTDYLPKYRVNPPRKFNWQLRGYYEDAR